MSSTFNRRTKISVIVDAESPRVPLWCPICKEAMASSLDIESHDRVGACRLCEDEIVEKNMLKWQEGWRPSEDDIAAVRKQRSYSLQERYLIRGG